MTELLQEYVDSGGVAMSVDRQVGILRGVKLIGLLSRNGRRYRESALAAAASLYEEAKVNVNHPKEGPLTPRDYQDRLGVIRRVELRTGEGLFGDLHFNPKHALAEQLLWDAEHNPHNVGFSHNVLARLSREGKISVVEEINKVQSIDLVADPATTQGLFEHTNQSEGVASKIEKRWDALTLEVLQLHRPDLLAEIQSHETSRLQRQLDEAEDLTTTLRKKQKIFELLCEYELSIASEDSTAVEGSHAKVSQRFVEALMHVDEKQDIEALIAERSKLAQLGSHKRVGEASCSPPFSRDQLSLLPSRLPVLESAQDFAATLKICRN